MEVLIVIFLGFVVMYVGFIVFSSGINSKRKMTKWWLIPIAFALVFGGLAISLWGLFLD